MIELYYSLFDLNRCKKLKYIFIYSQNLIQANHAKT